MFVTIGLTCQIVIPHPADDRHLCQHPRATASIPRLSDPASRARYPLVTVISTYPRVT